MLLEFFAGLTALGALVTAAGVLVAVRQVKAAETNVRQAEKLAQADFEDDLAREYRQIVHQLPAVAFYESGRLELDDELRNAFYRYFDLSNEQLYLADRIASATGRQGTGATGSAARCGFPCSRRRGRRSRRASRRTRSSTCAGSPRRGPVRDRSTTACNRGQSP